MKQQMQAQDHKCSLFPFEREDVLTLQEAKQQAGWNISAFDLPKAWQLTQGEGVRVAVLDSGCDIDHPDLRGNLLQGTNYCNPGKPPKDDNGHGTHATGIICAENNDIGTVGVAPKSKVIPVKVLDRSGNGTLENVAKGIRWAVQQKADIISMSLGAPTKLQQVRKAIQYAAKRGVPTFVAAGNAGNTKEVFYPAAYPETIAIGSINEEFDRSSFSNTGRNLDFMAPGSRIMSTVPDDWYAIMTGTSMACPWAVGIAALILSFARAKRLKISLKTVEDYRNVFRKHTTPIRNKDMDKKFYQGFGIIDPRKFLKNDLITG